jgi:hypothetical protein
VLVAPFLRIPWECVRGSGQLRDRPWGGPGVPVTITMSSLREEGLEEGGRGKGKHWIFITFHYKGPEVQTQASSPEGRTGAQCVPQATARPPDLPPRRPHARDLAWCVHAGDRAGDAEDTGGAGLGEGGFAYMKGAGPAKGQLPPGAEVGSAAPGARALSPAVLWSEVTG